MSFDQEILKKFLEANPRFFQTETGNEQDIPKFSIPSNIFPNPQFPRQFSSNIPASPSFDQFLNDQSIQYSVEEYNRLHELLKENIRKNNIVITNESLLDTVILQPVCDLFLKLSKTIDILANSLIYKIVLPEVEKFCAVQLLLQGVTDVTVGSYKAEIYIKPTFPSRSGSGESIILSPITTSARFEIKKNSTTLYLQPKSFLFLTTNKDEITPHPQFKKVVGEEITINDEKLVKFIIDLDMFNTDSKIKESIEIGDEIYSNDIYGFKFGKILSVPLFISKSNMEQLFNNFVVFDESSLLNLAKLMTNDEIQDLKVYGWHNENNIFDMLELHGTTLVFKLKTKPIKTSIIVPPQSSKLLKPYQLVVDTNNENVKIEFIVSEKFSKLSHQFLQKYFSNTVSNEYQLKINNNSQTEVAVEVLDLSKIQTFDSILHKIFNRKNITNIAVLYSLSN